MLLSKQTEYALRAVVGLARLYPHRFVQARDLAKQEALPMKFLEAILLRLRRGGFLESKVGREGGYRLARAPREIRLGDVIRRLDGRMSQSDARDDEQGSPGEAAVHLINEKLTEATDRVLDEITLQRLLEFANNAASQQKEMYFI